MNEIFVVSVSEGYWSSGDRDAPYIFGMAYELPVINLWTILWSLPQFQWRFR